MPPVVSSVVPADRPMQPSPSASNSPSAKTPRVAEPSMLPERPRREAAAEGRIAGGGVERSAARLVAVDEEARA